MSVRKQRATVSATYAFGSEYYAVLQKAKRIHRYDGEFYLYKIIDSWSSVSESDIRLGIVKDKMQEHWKFINNRWQKVIDAGTIGGEMVKKMIENLNK